MAYVSAYKHRDEEPDLSHQSLLAMLQRFFEILYCDYFWGVKFYCLTAESLNIFCSFNFCGFQVSI